ncbi:MAG TPA: hypothetical protein VMI94_01325 [Bryobacteraceae bacterium]|nr:hypothetical protein [Bryobacteraceae bacterium]
MSGPNLVCYPCLVADASIGVDGGGTSLRGRQWLIAVRLAWRRSIGSRQHLSLPLLAVGFLAAVAQVPLGLSNAAFGSHNEIISVAKSLAATGRFQDPFGSVTGATAHVAPVYPAILAAIMILLRQPALVVAGAIFVNAFLWGLTAALLPILSQRIYGRAAPGNVGGILVVLSSWMMPQWETALSAALLLAATMAVLSDGAVRAGLWSGVCLLANPVSLPMLLLVSVSRGRRFAAVSMLVALGVTGPWVLRNWVELGTPYFVRDNLGLELYISNNDEAGPLLRANAALANHHPTQNEREAMRVASMGEGPYNRMRLHDGVRWIAAHPRRFLSLSAARVFYYWFTNPREGWTAPAEWLLTILGAVGVWISRRNRGAMYLAAGSVCYFLPFVCIQVCGRYHAPVLWVSALLGGCAITFLWPRLSSLSKHSERWHRGSREPVPAPEGLELTWLPTREQ